METRCSARRRDCARPLVFAGTGHLGKFGGARRGSRGRLFWHGRGLFRAKERGSANRYGGGHYGARLCRLMSESRVFCADVLRSWRLGCDNRASQMPQFFSLALVCADVSWLRHPVWRVYPGVVGHVDGQCALDSRE